MAISLVGTALNLLGDGSRDDSASRSWNLERVASLDVAHA
jgi:hypothetical protein